MQNLVCLPLRQHLPGADLEPQLRRERADHHGRELRRRRAAASFYDEAGAIRDVVQNHLLQVVGVLAMEPPVDHATRSRSATSRSRCFRAIRPLEPDDVVRGQFRGYREEPGVAPDSHGRDLRRACGCDIDSWRWEGVPFFIRAGKCLPVTATEVLVELKRPPLAQARARRSGNYFRFRLSPDVVIALGARVKKPGEAMVGEPTRARRSCTTGRDEMDAYERLLGDAMAGDADALRPRGRGRGGVADRRAGARQRDAGARVRAGTWGPAEADRLAADVGGWARPSSAT